MNVAFNYDIGDFEVLYVDFRTKSLDMDLLSIYDVSGFRGDVYDENGAYKDEAKNLLVERISRLGKGNSTEVQGVEDFQQRESGADALRGNADENIRRAESEVERNPSEAQKEAGNYRKGHVRVDGLDVTIENPKGSVRSGTDADGKRWETVMNNTYGYMRGTEGVDGDHIDVFLSDNPESGNVYVVDQRDPKTGEFDEHKVMYGFGSMEEARDAYLKNYTPGWQGLGAITEVSKDEFKKWIGSSKRKTKPFAEYKSAKKEAGQNEVNSPANIQPIATGDFGPIYDQFVGKPKEAIEFLSERQGGEAKGALHHKDVGNIDLVWGNEKMGLLHIIDKHPEVLENLQGKLNDMHIVSSSDNRIVLESDTHKAVVSNNWNGKKTDNWLLTTYKKKKGVSGGSIDIDPEPVGKQNGTAPLQNTLSTDKDNDKSEPTQTSAEKTGEEWQPHALPGRLMKAYESGDEALIAAVEQDMRNFVNAAKDMRSVYVTYLRSKDLERSMEKGSPSNKTQHFIAEACKDALKKAGLPVKAMQSERARTDVAGSTTDARVLDIMSADTSFDVLRAIVHNPNISEATLKYFTEAFSNNGLDYEAQQVLDKRSQERKKEEANIAAEEAAIRDAIVERLRESGIEVITDAEAGQRVLDEANGRGEPVRTQAMLDGLAKAASTIRGWIKGNRRGRVFTIDLPESTQRKIKEAMGRDFDSHNITANGIAHALKNHGVGGYKLNERSIPLREEDMELIPYIMTAPDDVKKASTDVSGRESVRFYKNLSNGYVVVVEKEYKNSPDDMETITMWAELSSGATNARQNAVPDTHVLNAIPSTDSAKIRKDAEDAIHGDEKVREHRVYHGSGADFEAFDHSHMGEGEGAQAYGWGSYVTEVEGIGRTYAKASTENKRENATVYKRRQIRDNEISINVIRGMIAEYPEQHREREKRLSDLEKELADQNSQKGRIEKESGKDSVAYRNFMFYAEDIIKDLERNIERTKRSIEDEAGYNEQRKRQVEELVAENARLQSEIDAIEAQYPRHLYTVEIPDDTGENYLEWEKPVTKEQQGKIYKQLRDEKMTIKGASQSFWNGKSSEWQSGQKLIDFFIENLGSDKAASEFLSRAGFTGISYPAQATTGGRKDGARNYVIFDEKDLQITDHVRFFRTPGGEAYGFTVGGKIYIDPRTTTADTPIHEYAHLWAGALRQANPKEWNNIVDLMRDTPAWDEVKRLYPELESDEEIADEALAMYSGRRGAERLREAARRAWDGSADLGAKAAAARAMGRVRDALKRFWKGVADFLHIHYTSAEEVADKVMSDLLEGVNPNSRAELSAEERAIEEQAKKDGTWMKAPNGKPTNLTERQWVQVRTRAFKRWFGDWEKAARIEKLRKSQPIIVSGNDYQGKYELNSKSAEDYIVKSLRGEYVNKDTGNTVNITRASRKVAHHDAKHDVHLKSIAYIPQMIENAIFIDEVHNEKGTKFDSYRYYVVGLKMDGVDYTAKLVVGRKNGESYYDHALTEIEKNSLLNLTDGVKADVSDKEAAVSAVKDKRLLSLLQTNSSKVVDENGEPLVVYHGSDYRPLNGNGILIPNNGAMGKAVYFSSAFPEAADYAREKLGDMSLSEDEVYDNGYITEVFVNVRDEEDIAPSSYGNGEIIVAVRESNRIKSATDNTGAFSAGNDDIRYSRAEEDKSLVAVHNTSEENLKKALELGGFPMPSIAVTKADVGHTEFGEISLVFGRESIDPTDRRNKVYGEDAWTPTFPQTGYKLNEKKTNAIYSRVNKAGDLPLLRSVSFHPDNYESYIGGLDSKSLVEHFKDDYGAKQLYLYENGNAVDKWERHEVEKYLPDQVALSTKLLEEIGLERLKGEKDETLENEAKRIVNDHYGIDLDGMPPFRAKVRIGNAISRAVDYAENGNLKTEADAEATKKKIDERTDPKKFHAWLEDLFDGIVEKRGIRNDKDPFTASGNRRKWEQLYDEITLDNVVEAMRRQAARGGQGLFGGSIFGAAQEEYKDIDSIRKAAKRRIRMMSHEEAETGRKTITDRLSAIEIPGVGERFSDVMDMVQNIQDAVARSHTAKGIYKYLKAFYPKVTMETANEIADIVKDIQAMSARYFEAKPYRAVGFDEVRLAVVPSDTDAGLVEQLKRKGIPVREYERGNEAERRAIVEEATDEMELRFREAEEDDANRRFNEELSGLTEENADKVVLSLGRPSAILRAAGVEDKPMKLYGNKVIKKMKKHGFRLDELQNLPEAVAEPIAVFNNYQKDSNRSILTELRTSNGNFLVTVDLGKDADVDFNIVTSVFGKGDNNIIGWINKGYATYIDKEKAQEFLSHQSAPIAATAANSELDTATNIVKDFENPALEDENLFRIGETKRIGGESLFGRRITFTRANPTVTLNAMKRWVLKNADLKEYDVARTGSRYLSFTHNGVDYKIRSANHTRAYDGNRPENSGLSVSVEDTIYEVEIDLAENEMVKEDILRIIEDTDRLNDTGLNLQNTVESGVLLDEMVSVDRELTDAVIREVREMAEWRLDSARTKAESEYEREHPLEDYKADNGIMILNRYFYGRVSYEVKFPDGWRGKTKQPRADAIQEYEDSDAHRRNMEQASGMNVYVDGRTKAQAETLRKIDGLANRLEQERMAGAVREMAERLHLEGVEVVTDASTLTGRRARAKGFYSPRTGKISIVIPNHASEADAVQTLLHEAVAHKGLRQLFGEHFDTFLWNVYRNADRDVRERINALASEKGWDFPTATEEYLASLAENMDFENAQRSGWWEKIKRLFIDMLHKMGLDGFSGVTLSDNELRYILWRSYENLREPGAERSITGVAADVVKQAELKVGNYAEEATGGNMAAEENDDDLMYRFIGERGASRLDAEEEATTRLDNLDLARRMEQAYNDRKARIEKLRGAKPVKIKGDEIEPSEDLKQYKKNALEYGKKLRGEYTNKDTNETISLTAGNSRGGIREILQHDYKDVEHLQSIAAIPQIIENSIFIDELPNEDNKKYPGVKSFSYYVCGLKINGVDYTVKAVIANQSNGERYYDHKLTNIEKGELLSIVPTIQKAGIDSKTPYSSVKDKRLVSILQTDEKENARKIKVATGWERGADGKWRYETPDIKYTPVKNIEEGKFYQLSDFVNDKDLFNAYPELKFVKVVFRYEPDGRYGGYWNIGENLIDINTAHSTSNHYKNTLVHEIQHAIQDIEGFVPGGDRSLAYEYYIKDGEYLGNFNKNELNELYELRRMAERLVDEGKYKRIGNAINHVLKTAKENGYYLKWVVDDYDKTPYYVLQEYTSAELKKARDLNDEKFYMSISGEVEARNAEKRMGMSENKRRNTLAKETEDVAREDQIFLEKTLGDTKRGKSLSIFEDRNSAAEDGTRDTPLSSPTIHAWDRLAQSLKFQLRETAVDYLTAIDKFQDLIAKHSGRKIESFENAYDWMTFLSSRNRVEMDMFDSSVVRPLNNAILKLIKNGGTKQPIIFPCVF